MRSLYNGHFEGPGIPTQTYPKIGEFMHHALIDSVFLLRLGSNLLGNFRPIASNIFMRVETLTWRFANWIYIACMHADMFGLFLLQQPCVTRMAFRPNSRNSSTRPIALWWYDVAITMTTSVKQICSTSPWAPLHTNQNWNRWAQIEWEHVALQHAGPQTRCFSSQTVPQTSYAQPSSHRWSLLHA